jgi:hypothetical protein
MCGLPPTSKFSGHRLGRPAAGRSLSAPLPNGVREPEGQSFSTAPGHGNGKTSAGSLKPL